MTEQTVKATTEELGEITLPVEEKALLDKMVETGVLRGRKHSRTNPKMNPYIWGTRRGVDIFDLLETMRLLKSAGEFLKTLVDGKKPIFVVCGKPAIKDIIEDFAKKNNFPFVTERYLGGTLTNWKTISKRIETMKKLRMEKERGELTRYTKKERLMLDRKMEKMNTLFSGFENMGGLPAAILVVDPIEHRTVVHEANLLKIPVIGIASSDCNPDLVTHLIPANDNSRLSVSFLLAELEKIAQSAK
ncbi:MAG: 30S ribosomal protein S2 [Candidatus Harrisonbacteria bacterium]|nr:30S ribosomal protein S2 [Candidatus Harrisonbacteria bacterium]